MRVQAGERKGLHVRVRASSGSRPSCKGKVGRGGLDRARVPFLAPKRLVAVRVGYFGVFVARGGSAVGSTETTGIHGNVDESIYIEILLRKLSLGMNITVHESAFA